MIRRTASAIVLALGLATAAQAAEPVAVQVDGRAVTLPILDGFCEPTGPYVTIARQIAAFDTDNITLLTLDSCAQMAARSNRITTTSTSSSRSRRPARR